MAIYIRMKTNVDGLRIGEDAAVDGARAKRLQSEGMAWVTGGDTSDFTTHEITADTDVGPPIPYAAPANVVEVIPQQEG